jgi:hypothetical protein
MLNAEAEFLRREQEVSEYISHLESLDGQVGLSGTLVNTMKSSALLMIYNVVESTMTNLIQDVFDHLQAHQIAFHTLNDKMKALVLGYTKKRNPSALVAKMRESSLSLVVACFDRSEVFSGNLDCAKIRETLKDVGVTTTHSYREDALLKVKNERNNLAHGSKSFSDCGRDYTAVQLREFHRKTMAILARVIRDFEVFLHDASYA